MPDALCDRNTEQERMERLLDCLEHCLKELPASSRELLFEYYRDDYPGSNNAKPWRSVTA